MHKMKPSKKRKTDSTKKEQVSFIIICIQTFMIYKQKQTINKYVFKHALKKIQLIFTEKQ